MNKLRIMIRIRLFEERVARLKIKGPLHSCVGQEAVSAGVCLALDKKDFIIGNHRSHGHLIAKGSDVKHLMSQVLKGNGNSMHVNDPSIGAICSTAIVGSGPPLACGLAFASKFKNDDRIACVFLGDGAVSEGTFHESLNIASQLRLPVLFVIENNKVAVTTVPRQHNYHRFADSYGISNIKVDGQNVESVYNASVDAIRLIHNTGMPFVLEAETIRFHEHQEGAYYEKMKETNYRDNKEIEDWIENRDPIKLYSDKLIKGGISVDELADIYSQEKRLINSL